jgi:hypothetical protein
MIGLLLAAMTYIVPIAGNAGLDPWWHTTVTVTNPGPGNATVRVEELIRPPGAAPCVATPPATLAPGEYIGVGTDFRNACFGIYAMVLSSDRPVVVESRITTYSLQLSAQPEMRVDVAERWIEPEQEALIGGVGIAADFGQRANLLLVNPEDRAIDVRVTLTHRQFRASRDETFRVPARSVILQPLREVEDPKPPSGFPQIVIPDHDLLVRANGRFQAGASSIQAFGVGHYRGAIILTRD